jgi:hypothetical protein
MDEATASPDEEIAVAPSRKRLPTMATEPTNPYDPTDEDRDFARSVLNRAPEVNAHYILGCIEGCLYPGTSVGDPHSPDERDVRRARAFIAEWDEHRAVSE